MNSSLSVLSGSELGPESPVEHFLALLEAAEADEEVTTFSLARLSRASVSRRQPG